MSSFKPLEAIKHSLMQFYNSKMFKGTLSHKWPTQTIASSFKTHLLKQIATISKALKCYMAKPPGWVKTNSLQGINHTITSPVHEDALWIHNVMEAVQATLELARCENDEDEPPALTLTTASSRPPCGRNPITVATPATASAGPDASNANTSHKATIASTDSNAPMCSQDLNGSYTQSIKNVLVASAEWEAPSSMHRECSPVLRLPQADEQWLKHSCNQGDPNSWHMIRPVQDPDKVCTTESTPSVGKKNCWQWNERLYEFLWLNEWI